MLIARDGDQSLDILLLRRNDKIAFHGGAWVFPGGRVDDEDEHDAAMSELEIAKRAAVREAMEETGVTVTAESMVPFAHWTTPLELPKRFATWFFVALIDGDPQIHIDNSEIVDYRWLSAEQALSAHNAGELSLPGPTYVTLLRFKDIHTGAAMAAHLDASEVQRFVPRIAKIDDGRCALYHEDAGYESLDMSTPGPRHRLVMRGTDWDYQRDF